MATATPPLVVPPPGRLWPEPWAGSVAIDVIALQGQLDAALTAPPANAAAAQAVRGQVEELLAVALGATQRGRLPWRRLGDRWTGASVERAYVSLHAARTAMVEVLPDAEVQAQVPWAVAKVVDAVPAEDARRVRAEALLKATPLEGGAGITTSVRANLRMALETGYDAADQTHARLRGFRNIVVVVALAVLVFMALLVLLVWRSPSAVPLCFTPTITSTATTGTSTTKETSTATGTSPAVRTVCPSGPGLAEEVTARASRPEDLLLVAGLGMIGGALAAAFAVRKLRGDSTPYDVPLALAFLKVPVGALTAVAGILLLGGGFVPGLSELDSQGQILAYALLLGYAQQLVTRLIDRQAQTVLDAVPTKKAATASTEKP